MSRTYDPFDEDAPESTEETWVFRGVLVVAGVLVLAVGTVKWWRGFLFR